MFHSSVLVNQEGLHFYDDSTELKRYSIQYERGTDSLFPGISFKPSVVMYPTNSGMCLDEVCEHDGPFYRVRWPPLQEDKGREQDSGMTMLAPEMLPAAQA